MKKPRKWIPPIWRASDEQTGIGKIDSVPYTYEHVGRPPTAAAEIYRVEAYLPFDRPPVHRHVHYVPARRLDDFLNAWGEHSQIVVDVRPLTLAEAEAELRAFRERAEQR